ncbi:hypothetical protein [Planktothrix paucivesiculata]|uniref:Uncharacterized protein n=1 Tax=Planktothrix paucivesiculata PCC 9631 TaxID=671071 RepID=A0A7Z9BS78_9CYAN|nr:hypothetical protein [Planktothrix paucivesiculata]VXD21781.1 conserved hypothetical protein [Planktothrix paucivesiculata PCC 9631]
MSHNLIQAGVIVPSQWPLARVWLEVATLLSIAPRNIERLEFWQHQIWVKIEQKKAIFVSYRRLPLWKETGLDAIKNCSDRPYLDQLGEMLSLEVKQYPTQYESSILEAWRSAWAQKSQQLKLEAQRQAQEEERLRPLRERQQAAQQWHDGWKTILRYCNSFDGLERLAPELKQQSQEFADLPQGETAMELWHQRWQELTHATA